ncbi:MAG: potassium-transporting ATPase subunit KdpA [Bdellovibrionales bacterium]|nr:potassium-transporting ATPase subunit KdpA [Bdellovibrionales bacterium]
MNGYDFFQIFITLLILVVASPLIGKWMFRIFEISNSETGLTHKFESAFYRVAGIDPKEEMDWKHYSLAVLVFNFIGFVFLFLIQILQSKLPLNPQGLADVSWHSAFNSAISFMTNTNWQGYSGESTMSYLTQVLGLTVQNFVSAATGIGVVLALCRGLTQKSSRSLGNFWKDLTRSTLFILLPLSFVFALVLISQGVVQNFSSYSQAVGLDGISQVIPQGPAASQIAIKQLGTNGGGFFGVNSAHPLENPTPLSNWMQLIAILLLPASLVFTFGEYAKSRRQAWAIFIAMGTMLVVGLSASLVAEYSANPVLGHAAVMEGKETRLGVTNSVIWSVFTSAASNGSVNSMHSSLSPISGGIAMFNIMLGEVIFGGVGAGLYGMFLFVLLTVFLSGLMVGRTPEYLGKKIEALEIKMVILGVIIPSAAILIGAGLSSVLPVALSSLSNKGPHGLSEILYAFASAGGNNGSAFAGLNANTVYYNLALGVVMLIGRFGVILPVLAIAGSMSLKKQTPKGPGTFVTDSPLFVVLLIGVVIVVGGLTFLPALSLGPIIEHFLMSLGRSF